MKLISKGRYFELFIKKCSKKNFLIANLDESTNGRNSQITYYGVKEELLRR